LGSNHVFKGKESLDFSPKNNHVLEGSKLKLPLGGSHAFRGKKFLLPRDMIVPHGKKRSKLFFKTT